MLSEAKHLVSITVRITHWGEASLSAKRFPSTSLRACFAALRMTKVQGSVIDDGGLAGGVAPLGFVPEVG
jgi:hypothetical protein